MGVGTLFLDVRGRIPWNREAAELRFRGVLEMNLQSVLQSIDDSGRKLWWQSATSGTAGGR
jgi:hypothetical protein